MMDDDDADLEFIQLDLRVSGGLPRRHPLKRLLKCLLRSYGIKMLAIRKLEYDGTKPAWKSLEGQ